MGAWELEMVSGSPADRAPVDRSRTAEGEDRTAKDSSEGATTAIEQAREVPVGVGGFEFEMTAVQAQSACESAGNQWTADSKGRVCSGPVEQMGTVGTVQLLPCDEAFCQNPDHVGAIGTRAKDRREVCR